MSINNYKKKYNTKSIRLRSWDYSTSWWYFITIATKKHENYFGQIRNGKVHLNEIGKIVKNEWLMTKELRENIDLDEFIIMPNHFHGILFILEHDEIRRDVARNVSTNNSYFSQISPKSNSLSSIIRAFKSAVTRRVHKNCYDYFKWQDRFYDWIIRNENELYNIRKYIVQNPMKWELDNEIPENMRV